MEYEILPLKNIDFSVTGREAVIQNVSFLISSLSHTFPMDRSFGWTPNLDDPIPVVEATISAQLIGLLHKYEPGVELIEVQCEIDELNGMIKPVVRVRINDEI